MAQLKPQKFLIEAFREQASWIGALLQPLNLMFDDLRIAFNNQITISENLYQEIKEIKFKNETNSFPLRFRSKFNTFPKGVILIYAFNNDLAQPVGLNPALNWSFNNNQEVVINSISGLTTSQTYTIRLLVIYG